jgi:hypothetical protein
MALGAAHYFAYGAGVVPNGYERRVGRAEWFLVSSLISRVECTGGMSCRPKLQGSGFAGVGNGTMPDAV